MPPDTPLAEFLARHPALAVAWDRDCGDLVWFDGAGCHCISQRHGPRVMMKEIGANAPWPPYHFVTDGHGLGVKWQEDASDPLGGRWIATGRSLRIEGSYRRTDL